MSGEYFQRPEDSAPEECGQRGESEHQKEQKETGPDAHVLSGPVFPDQFLSGDQKVLHGAVAPDREKELLHRIADAFRERVIDARAARRDLADENCLFGKGSALIRPGQGAFRHGGKGLVKEKLRAADGLPLFGGQCDPDSGAGSSGMNGMSAHGALFRGHHGAREDGGAVFRHLIVRKAVGINALRRGQPAGSAYQKEQNSGAYEDSGRRAENSVRFSLIHR